MVGTCSDSSLSRSERRATSTTSTSRAASSRAMAAPIPADAPVTRARPIRAATSSSSVLGLAIVRNASGTRAATATRWARLPRRYGPAVRDRRRQGWWVTAPRSVLAVDGNALGHRAYRSAEAELDGGDDRPLVTGAVVSMLASTWVHGPYDAVLVGFDHPVNRRKLLAPEYKANRPPTPAALTAALQRLRSDLAACGFAVVEQDGAEADDVLAAAVDACVARRWRCDLLSSDRDLTALVSEDVRLLRPRARFSDLAVEDVARVRTTYGVDPERYVELAALRGDASDGLEGARGIGPKTAAKLLAAHGTIAALYEALPELPTRIESSLREARHRVERNLLLMAPVPHLEVDADALAAATVDPDRVRAVLEPLGLGAAARRFERAVTAPAPPPIAPHPAVGDLGADPTDHPASPVAHPHTPTQSRPLGPHAGEQEPLF
ncbi:MAG: hypothetical protein EA387_01590 [Nitriliruptor sp.]|nr:MAG: hypothetical protein EA387_01590 [Nitriliruptor sp.]